MDKIVEQEHELTCGGCIYFIEVEEIRGYCSHPEQQIVFAPLYSPEDFPACKDFNGG